MKKEGSRRKTTFEKKKILSGFARVMGRPTGSTRFYQVFTLTDLLSYLDWSNHQADQIPG
jgi:hypothetical protein